MRSPLSVPIGLLGAVLALTSLAPGAAFADSSSQTMPAGAPLTLVGRGYGHGHGMSQYGAQGAAKQGLTHQQILAFYYPGTRLTAARAMIRVLITEDTTNRTTVLARGRMRLKDLGRHRTYRLPATRDGHTVRAWRLREVHGRVRVAYLAGGWHRYRPGHRWNLGGDGELRSSTGVLALRTPSGWRHYRGGLRHSHGDTVNVLGLERYLRGVVPSEMPALWQSEALQAQAVAARTYALWSRSAHRRDYYQICDTSACQVYDGYDHEHPSTNAAIGATRGQVLTYGGAPAFTQFSASDGGYTVAGSRPYLSARADPYDGYAEWTETVDPADLEAAYPRLGTFTGLEVTARDGKGAYGGRVVSLVLHGTGGDVSLSGDRFRVLLGLKSTLFDLPGN